ncbi:hypothetical protein Tco_0326982 [Tanacetum coccineum]
MDQIVSLVGPVGALGINEYVLNSLVKIWYKRRCCSLIPTESDSLPHAHAQTTKTYYKHQDSRIKKAQELKTKTSANSDIKDTSSETKLRERLLESSLEDAKYEHVGQDTRSQDGKDGQYIQGKDLKISKQRRSRKPMTKAKDQRSHSMKEQAYNKIKTNTKTQVVERMDDVVETITTQSILYITPPNDVCKAPIANLILVELTHLICLGAVDGLEGMEREYQGFSLPTELKDLPSKFNDITEETVTSLTSKVAELKTLQWELPAEFFVVTSQVKMIQAKLKTLDALPSILNKVTNALNQFAQAITSKKTRGDSVPSAGQAGTQPTEGEKNTYQATIS